MIRPLDSKHYFKAFTGMKKFKFRFTFANFRQFHFQTPESKLISQRFGLMRVRFSFFYLYIEYTNATIELYLPTPVYLYANLAISDPKLGSILRLYFIKILTFKKMQHHDHRSVVKPGRTNILLSTCPPYCRNYPRRSSANWGRLKTKLPGRLMDYDWHIKLVARIMLKIMLVFEIILLFLKVCFSRRKHKTSPNCVFIIDPYPDLPR